MKRMALVLSALFFLSLGVAACDQQGGGGGNQQEQSGTTNQ